MERESGVWDTWPLFWSALWVGTLAALAIGLVIGLIGFSVGAHELSHVVDWKHVRLLTLVFNVAGAFFSFVTGGWVAARIAGIAGQNQRCCTEPSFGC
jgi:membrane protein required for beta-lactamase induction